MVSLHTFRTAAVRYEHYGVDAWQRATNLAIVVRSEPDAPPTPTRTHTHSQNIPRETPERSHSLAGVGAFRAPRAGGECTPNYGTAVDHK